MFWAGFVVGVAASIVAGLTMYCYTVIASGRLSWPVFRLHSAKISESLRPQKANGTNFETWCCVAKPGCFA